MTRILFTLILCLLLIICSSKGQSFQIDHTISENIDSIFKANVLLDSPIKAEFSFHVVKTFDPERFGEHGMDLAYFLKGDGFQPTDQYVSSITRCYLSKDTIVLMGGLFYESGIGFRITIFNDNFDSQLYLVSSEKIYSKTDKKNGFGKEIFVNSDAAVMTLVQKPNFIIGSTLKGKLAIRSESFYQLDKDLVPFKLKPEFEIIFDTKVKDENELD